MSGKAETSRTVACKAIALVRLISGRCPIGRLWSVSSNGSIKLSAFWPHARSRMLPAPASLSASSPLAYPSGEQRFLRVGPCREEFRGDVFPFVLVVFLVVFVLRNARQFADSETDAAALHHAQKDFLFLGRVTGPYQRFERSARLKRP
jgi:hypothetical protein